MNYWLMKSEPSEFSIDDLMKMPNQMAHWDGVRNYQARNMLRDQMKVGDLAFFYHSNCNEPSIVGIMKIVKNGYPDFTAFDTAHEKYDPNSKSDKPCWYMVDLQFVRKLKRNITLEALKKQSKFSKSPLVQRGNRLSIIPVTPAQWQCVLDME